MADKTREAKRRIVEILRAFVLWSKKHPGAPCPSAAYLAKAMGGVHSFVDPWSNPLSITCRKQPEGQVIGVSSAGPDGKFDHRDDIAGDDIHSWNLGDNVTDIVQGQRWLPQRRAPMSPRKPTAPRTPAPDDKREYYDKGIPAAP